jgi:hypothetical protein
MSLKACTKGLAIALGLLIGHLIASLVPAKKGSFPGEVKV